MAEDTRTDDQTTQTDAFGRDQAQQASDESRAFTEAVASTKTMAVFCDPRASTLRLPESVYDVVATFGIEEVLLDFETEAACAVAEGLQRRGVRTVLMRYDGEASVPEAHVHLLDAVAGTTDVDPREAAILEAKVLVVPAMQANGIEPVDALNPRFESFIDYAPNRRVGIVLQQCARVGRQILSIEPPERGLVSVPVRPEDGVSDAVLEEAVEGTVWRRRIVHHLNAPTAASTLALQPEEGSAPGGPLG